jgi:DNA invertase Pin-like site-specific DNA recombinase
MKLIGYCRVSSEQQAKEGLSLALQADKIRAYCSLNDYTVVEIITDAGISAKNISGRPGLKRALDMVMSGKADGLVAWKLDRMFRSTVDALQTAEMFRANGKSLQSISERLDTSSAMGEFFFSLMASLATMERRLTGERTKSILDGKKARGEFVGKPKFGYQSAGKSLQANDPQQQIISMIRDLSAQGLSFRCVAQRLNAANILTKQSKCWTHKQISSILATL